MEQDKKLKTFIKTTIREFLNEQKESESLENLSDVILKRKMTGDWFWVVCGYVTKDNYGKDNPKYIIADVYAKNKKIYANIHTASPEELSDVISRSVIIDELPEKYKKAFDKLENEYNLYPEGR